MFITDDGHLGIGSRRSQVGDLICVFFGCNVPYILRPAGQYYTIVGECYVHGLRKEEAISAWRDGILLEERFHLC